MKHGEHKPDISRADFFYCMLCAQRGWSIEETAGRLMEISTKAKENGPHYARFTAENARPLIKPVQWQAIEVSPSNAIAMLIPMRK
jgi:hypothetical protein